MFYMRPLIGGLCVLRWGGLNKPGLPVAAMNNDIYFYGYGGGSEVSALRRSLFPLGFICKCFTIENTGFGGI